MKHRMGQVSGRRRGRGGRRAARDRVLVGPVRTRRITSGLEPGRTRHHAGERERAGSALADDLPRHLRHADGQRQSLLDRCGRNPEATARVRGGRRDGMQRYSSHLLPAMDCSSLREPLRGRGLGRRLRGRGRPGVRGRLDAGSRVAGDSRCSMRTVKRAAAAAPKSCAPLWTASWGPRRTARWRGARGRLTVAWYAEHAFHSRRGHGLRCRGGERLHERHDDDVFADLQHDSTESWWTDRGRRESPRRASRTSESGCSTRPGSTGAPTRSARRNASFRVTGPPAISGTTVYGADGVFDLDTTVGCPFLGCDPTWSTTLAVHAPHRPTDGRGGSGLRPRDRRGDPHRGRRGLRRGRQRELLRRAAGLHTGRPVRHQQLRRRDRRDRVVGLRLDRPDAALGRGAAGVRSRRGRRLRRHSGACDPLWKMPLSSELGVPSPSIVTNGLVAVSGDEGGIQAFAMPQ